MEEKKSTYASKTTQDIMNKYKGMIGREFEKICPTQTSFKAELHTLHDIFEMFTAELESKYTLK